MLGKGVDEVGGMTGQEPEVSRRRLTKYTSGVLGMSSSREEFCGRKLIASPHKRIGGRSLGREQGDPVQTKPQTGYPAQERREQAWK